MSFLENLTRIILLGQGISAKKFLEKYPHPLPSDFFEVQEGYEEPAGVLLAREGFFNIEKVIPKEIWNDRQQMNQLVRLLQDSEEDNVERTADNLILAQELKLDFQKDYQRNNQTDDVKMAGLQITMVRHGEYDQADKHLNEDGVDDMTHAAMILKGASYFSSIGIKPFVKGDFPAGYKPDLIVTSQITRAIESGYVLHKQLEAMGVSTDIKTGVAYFNEIERYWHDNIMPDVMPGLVQEEQTKQSIDFLRDCAQKGYRHIVVVSHKPNVQVIGAALTGNMALPPTETYGDMVSMWCGKPENLGKVDCSYGTATLHRSCEIMGEVAPFVTYQEMNKVWKPLPHRQIISELERQTGNTVPRSRDFSR